MTAPRRRLNNNEYLAMYLAQDGKCICGECGGAPLIPKRIHQQHWPPYELEKDTPGYNGKPSRLYTEECHVAITKTRDGPMIVKARHQGGGKGSQQAKKMNAFYKPLRSKNTLGGKEGKRRRQWAKEQRK